MTRAARKTMGGIRGGGGMKKLGREKGERHGQEVGDTAVCWYDRKETKAGKDPKIEERPKRNSRKFITALFERGYSIFRSLHLLSRKMTHVAWNIPTSGCCATYVAPISHRTVHIYFRIFQPALYKFRQTSETKLYIFLDISTTIYVFLCLKLLL
jgi:hypothetical protein